MQIIFQEKVPVKTFNISDFQHIPLRNSMVLKLHNIDDVRGGITSTDVGGGGGGG